MKGIDFDMEGSAGTTGAAGAKVSATSSDMERAELLFVLGATKAEVDAAEAKRMTDDSFIVLILLDDVVL
jgi:hypothetical protein